MKIAAVNSNKKNSSFNFKDCPSNAKLNKSQKKEDEPSFAYLFCFFNF